MADPGLGVVVAIVAAALVFDFINGFHDAANSIATVVSTRVLSPGKAVVWAAFFNFVAAFTFGTAVAKTIGSGMIDIEIVTFAVIAGGLIGAIVWDLITWYYGLPTSSSHALIGGYAGAAVTKAGWSAILWGEKWIRTLEFIALSPLIGMAAGFALMVAVYWIFHRVVPARVDRTFRVAQLASSALFSFSHGANDAQKTMGIIVGLLDLILTYSNPGAAYGVAGSVLVLLWTLFILSAIVIVGAIINAVLGRRFDRKLIAGLQSRPPELPRGKRIDVAIYR